ncbi:MAG: TonB-dependent receptor, partial [Thermoanaerobaculum sp.]|nr:TonB-dependent receptor [Thermoanaerobaculum sp.]
LGSALRKVPAVVMARYNVVGSYGGADGGAIFIRGQGSSRPGAELSVLMDGIPRFVGVWTHPLLDLVNPSMAQQLEVHRNPEPVLLGNMAFAAVNLKPKEATAGQGQTRFVGAAGRWSTGVGLVEHGGRVAGLSYFVQAERRRSEGHRNNAAGEVDHAFLHLKQSLGTSWQLRLLADVSEGWAEDPGPVGGPPRGVVPRFLVKDTFGVATLEHSHGPLEGSLKVYLQNGDIHWRQWDGSRRQAFVTFTDFVSRGVRWQERWRGPQGLSVAFGVDYDQYGGATQERRPTNTFTFSRTLLTNTSAYVLVGTRWGEKVQVEPSAGLRLLDSRQFGGEWGGQAGVVVSFGASRLYLRASRGFNLPGLYTAVFFRRWNQPRSFEELEPERMEHWEGGYQWRRDAFSLTLSLFDEKVSHALRFRAIPPPPIFVNVGSYRVRGGELFLQWQPLPQWALTGAYSIMDPEPETVPNAPKWSGALGVTWTPTDWLRFSADGLRMARRMVLNPRYSSSGPWVPAFTTLNGMVALRLYSSAGRSWELFLSGENVTGERFYYQPNYPGPSRQWMGGISARF